MNTYADIEVARQPPVCELCVTRMSDEAGISRAEARRRLATPTDRGQRRRNLRRGDSMTTQPQTERTTLAAWLLEQIAEDERAAQRATEPRLPLLAVRDLGVGGDGCLLIHPARVLADCEAKRKIVKDCKRALRKRGGQTDAGYYAHRALRILAQPYADRPGFDPEWGIE